ncbi:hypothetical protein ACFL1M_00540 [Patescibacteria group bacterium]
MRNFFKHHRLLLLSLAIITVIFWQITNGEFVWDDYYFIVGWEEIKNPLENFGKLLSGNIPIAEGKIYRPLRSIFYSISYKFWGENPTGYKVQALIVHLISAAVCYFTSLKILKNKKQSTISSILFGIHPMVVEAVAFTTASFDTIGNMFFLISFYTYLISKNKKTTVLKKISYISAFIAFFTNELTLTLPLIIIIYDMVMEKNSFKNIKKMFSTYKPYLIINGSYWLTRVFVKVSSAEKEYRILGSLYSSSLVMVRAVVKYIQLLLFPIRSTNNHVVYRNVTNLYHADFNFPENNFIPDILDPEILLSGLVIILLILFSIKFSKKLSVTSFSLLTILISLTPVLQIFPSQTVFAERYLYIAIFFFSILLVDLLFRIKQKELSSMLIIVIILFFSIKSEKNINTWKTRKSLWLNANKYTPQSAMTAVNIGLIEYVSGNHEVGISMLEKAIDLNPNNFFARKKLAYLYLDQENIELAIKQYNILIKRNPDKNVALKTVGDIFKSEGYPQIAEQYYQKIIN